MVRSGQLGWLNLSVRSGGCLECRSGCYPDRVDFEKKLFLRVHHNRSVPRGRFLAQFGRAFKVGHFLVEDTAAGSHPLDLSSPKRPPISQAVAVVDCAGENVCDRFYAAMRVQGESGDIVVWIFVPEIVKLILIVERCRLAARNSRKIANRAQAYKREGAVATHLTSPDYINILRGAVVCSTVLLQAV